MDVEPLVARFNRWDISTCVLNTASLGNAIAIFRLEIIGRFVKDLPTSKLCLSPVGSE